MGKQVSRRRIRRIMNQEGLVSNYTTVQFKLQKNTCKESKTENVWKRQFQNRKYRDVVISDLTYVRVGGRWNYICILIDLFNREIIEYSAGEHKTADLVHLERIMGRSPGLIKDFSGEVNVSGGEDARIHIIINGLFREHDLIGAVGTDMVDGLAFLD